MSVENQRSMKSMHTGDDIVDSNECKGSTMIRWKNILLLSALPVLFFDGPSYCQNITVTGSWTLAIDASNLQSGAGSDLISTYTSDADQIKIDVKKTKLTWQVTVRSSGINWHPSFHFSVRRTSDGTGPGSVSGGTSWLEVTDVDQLFFSGENDKSNMDIQCRLSGMSLQVAPEFYSNTIIYTVTEI